MDPSLVKNNTPTKSTNRRPSIESDHSKKKSARACAPCRKRKVKKKRESKHKGYHSKHDMICSR